MPKIRLVLVLIFALLGVSGCGGDEPASDSATRPPTTVAPANTITQAVAVAPTVSPTASPTPTLPTPPTLMPTATSAPPTLTATPFPTLTPTPPPLLYLSLPDYSDVELAVLAELNQWRIEQNLAPFKPNAVLNSLAESQATYLINLPDLPNDFHVDGQGRYPAQRAIAAPYNWTFYGRTDRVAIGEIAYVGYNHQTALQFWRNSTIHHNTVVNMAYREIGIAAVPHPYGHLFIVVFGARPNVLPALVEPRSGKLYLTAELYPYAAGGAWIQQVDGVQLLPSITNAADENRWQSWSRQTDGLWSTVGTAYGVAIRGGGYQVVTVVNPLADIVWLPSNLPSADSDLLYTVPLAAMPTATQASQQEPVATVTPTPMPQATANDPTPTSVFRGKAVLLAYDERALSIINLAGEPLDLSGIILTNGTQRILVTSWQTEFLTVPLTAFPTGDCLQVWAWSETNAPAKPDQCNFRRSAINIAPTSRFWLSAEFQVQNNGVILATCPAGSQFCAVELH